jgi:hypothetical protein
VQIDFRVSLSADEAALCDIDAEKMDDLVNLPFCEIVRNLEFRHGSTRLCDWTVTALPSCGSSAYPTRFVFVRDAEPHARFS